MKQKPYEFMLLTQINYTSHNAYLRFIEECIMGGITCIQLREKSLSEKELEEFAIKLKTLLDKYHVPLIINDNVELALKINAAGVHLGQKDIHPQQARKILGEDKIIGLSIESEEQFLASQLFPINYIAASAVFETSTKTDLKKIWGLKGLKQLSSQSSLPVLAIGGVNQNNLLSVLQHGASGIAVISEIHNAINLQEKLTHISTTLKSWRTLHA